MIVQLKSHLFLHFRLSQQVEMAHRVLKDEFGGVKVQLKPKKVTEK